MEVIVLGAYGHVGRFVVRGLINMDFITRVIATGRNQVKLTACFLDISSEKIKLQTLDAYNFHSLREICENGDLVINCVGPYLTNGSKIAEEVIKLGIHYIDFANEQEHYRRLEKIDDLAKKHRVSLITGVGTTPGISTMLFQKGIENVPGATEAAMYWASGRHPTRDEGLGSTLGAIIENAYEPRSYINNEYKIVHLGEERRKVEMPDPFGCLNMVAFPTIDAIIVPNIIKIANVRTFWAMGEIPWYLNFLTKLIRPHKRMWSYNLLKKILEDRMHTEYDKALKQSIGTESIMKVIITSPIKSYEMCMNFPQGGGASAAYTVLLVSKKLLTGELMKFGLVSLQDNIISPPELLNFMSEAGWKGNLLTKAF